MDPNTNDISTPTPAGDGTTTTKDVPGERGVAPMSIGRYRVIRLLGRGGMGEVYLAHDPVLDREIAVKLIGAGIDNPDGRRRLVEEARAAGRLRHPNIVTIFDAGEHAGNSYIAMEHVGGETVRSLIERRAPFSPGRKLALFEGACAGLAHAHRANVVHFDVKPDNLMLDARGMLKVLDFGVARVMKSEVLVTQHVAGTLRYMSPEQLSGRPLDRRSDVFSLGSSLFEFLAYEPAYVGSAHEIIARITAGPVPHLVDVLPWVDLRLDALISRAMALEPSERFDDLDELADALRQFRQQLDPIDESQFQARSSAAPSSPRLATAAVISRPRRATLAVIVAASMVAIGVGALWMRAPGSIPERQAPAALVRADPPATPDTRSLPQSSDPAATTTPTSTAGLKPATGTPSAAPTSPATSRPAPASSRASSAAAAASKQRETVKDLSSSTTTANREGASPVQPQIPSQGAGAIRGAPPPTSIEPASPIDPPPADRVETVNTNPTPTSPDANPPVAPTNESSEVFAALRRYREAYAALDASAVQRIYPTLGAGDLEKIRQSSKILTTHQIEVGQPQVEVRDNMATVRAFVTQRFVPKVGSPQTIGAVETVFRLQRGANGWIITDVKVNP